MKRKISFLVAGCIVTVIALAAIQGYFIYNTYQLRVKEANTAITQEYLKLETTGKFDSINSAWMRKTSRFMSDYYWGKANKEDLKTMMKRVSDSLSGEMNRFVKKEHFFEEYDVSYSNYIKSIVMWHNCSQTDTIFDGKMLVYGNNDTGSLESPASQSTWNDAKYSDDNNSIEQYSYKVMSQRFYSIENWEKKILIKMSGLLVFSVLLLLFVVALFYMSIKNLIIQKKIADIKTDFINNITHEFQTPLGALDIAIKTLKGKNELTPEQFDHSLDIINRQNVRMQKLFGQVREASLSNAISIEKAQALGCEALKEIINDFKLSHPQVSINCEDKGAVLRIDRFHLTTILMNLLDNAVKYGADDIAIIISNAGAKSILTVKDNGMGIPQKEQKAIFEKFYRIQKGDIHTTKGLGLGLYYVNMLVQAYKGEITVKSDGARGSEFIITLPQT